MWPGLQSRIRNWGLIFVLLPGKRLCNAFFYHGHRDAGYGLSMFEDVLFCIFFSYICKTL